MLFNNLFAMRNAIEEYTYDKQKAPQSLQDMVTDGYLREVPRDPITASNDSWKIIMEDAAQAVNPNRTGHLRCSQRIQSEKPRWQLVRGLVSIFAFEDRWPNFE